MSSDCKAYYGSREALVEGFMCPEPNSTALFCCGFSDALFCCDDPNNFFPYEYTYMWWLSVGAVTGLSIAGVVLLAFIITLCILCYLFIVTKPRGLDNGLPLRAQGTESSPQEGPSQPSAPAGSQWLRKHFPRGKLDCNNQPAEHDRLFQHCFMATVTTINVESPV
ncbi:protein shisa-like-2A [Lampris incognitus]|uniref:protein shisa-like-2A n=1 Tax=Lampris incognitus TaxID=2546036 RepID=UPI0024B5D108|nr:protein shisa-like-2A [Lampris incognitus]